MGISINSVVGVSGKLSANQNLSGVISYSSKEVFVDTAFTFKGSVEQFIDLAGIVGENGDVYYVEDSETNYAYSDAQWYDIGTNTMEEGLTAAQIAELQGMVV